MEENKSNINVDHPIVATRYLDVLVFGIAWVITIAAITAGYAPLLMAPFLVLFTVATMILKLLQSPASFSISAAPQLFCTRNTPATSVAFGFAAYIALSTLWSADFMSSMSKAVLMACVVIACCLGQYLTTSASKLQIHRIARGILIGTLIALIFPLVELTTDHAILNLIADQHPHLIKTIGAADRVPGYFLNRSVSALGLFVWPALLVAYLWTGRPNRMVFLVSLSAAIAVAIFLSESETAKVALALGIVGFFTACYIPHILHLAMKVLWVIAVVGAIPIVIGLHWLGLQDNKSLPYSARDRIHIWYYTASLVPDNPILGIGIRSSRFDKKILKPSTAAPPPAPRVARLRDHPGWHSHNIFLQTWYELGVVGAGFLLILGLLVLDAIKAIKTRLQPFAYAAFASFSAIGAFGYGVWQSWLLACFGWTIIFFLFALRYSDDRPRTGNGKQTS